MKKSILIVGAGYMAREYVKVLRALKRTCIVVGRGEKSAGLFEKETGMPVIRGGLKNAILKDSKFDTAIVATDIDDLGEMTRLLLANEVKSILVEKPGGIDRRDIMKTERLALTKKAAAYVAYNRRFYASVIKARDLIRRDNGALSFTFDFTERVDLIPFDNLSSSVRHNWFLANSSHVADLAFFLGGKPKVLNALATGGLPWHPSASIFAGCGVCENGALYSYHANWQSGGRWGVEIMTPRRKLILRPLEKLCIQKRNSFIIEEVSIDDSLDRKYKPGLFVQTKAFLNGETKDLVSMSEQAQNAEFYGRISSEQ